MSPPLRVALIGTNYGANVQLPGFRLVEGVEVVAVTSGRYERAQAVASRFGIPHAFHDYRTMLDSVPVDLVSIATPPYLHHQMVLEAARRGVHVVCEKPLALNARQAEEMLDAVNAQRLKHAVDFQFRYYRGLTGMKLALEQGLIGEPRLARIVWCSDVRSTTEKSPYSWWSEREMGGGVLGAVASHWIDALRWWFGEPDSISSQLNTYVAARKDELGVERRVTTEDTAHLVMRLGALGTQASVDVSMVVGPPLCRVEAYGTRGALVMDGYNDLRLTMDSGSFEPVPLVESRFATDAALPQNVPAFAELVADLRDVIGGSAGHRHPDFSDGLAVQRVLDAATTTPKY